MILELPDIKDTVCGRELLEEGRTEGRQEGRQEGKEDALSQAAIRFAEGRFGAVPQEVAVAIKDLSVKDSDSLISALATSLKSVDDLSLWLKSK